MRGVWFEGRLQTDADRERVVEGLAGLEGGEGIDAADLGAKLKVLSPRWFVMRDVHRREVATFPIEPRLIESLELLPHSGYQPDLSGNRGVRAKESISFRNCLAELLAFLEKARDERAEVTLTYYW